MSWRRQREPKTEGVGVTATETVSLTEKVLKLVTGDEINGDVETKELSALRWRYVH